MNRLRAQNARSTANTNAICLALWRCNAIAMNVLARTRRLIAAQSKVFVLYYIHASVNVQIVLIYRSWRIETCAAVRTDRILHIIDDARSGCLHLNLVLRKDVCARASIVCKDGAAPQRACVCVVCAHLGHVPQHGCERISYLRCCAASGRRIVAGSQRIARVER